MTIKGNTNKALIGRVSLAEKENRNEMNVIHICAYTNTEHKNEK